MHSVAAAAQEFDLLLTLAMRAGHLDIESLLACYIRLEPLHYPGLGASQRGDMEQGQKQSSKIDLETLSTLITRLPSEYWHASELMLVPSLDGFPYQEVPPLWGLDAGRLGDDSLLVAIPRGLDDLRTLVTGLCVLRLEAKKAAVLTPPHLFAGSEHNKSHGESDQEDTRESLDAAWSDEDEHGWGESEETVRPEGDAGSNYQPIITRLGEMTEGREKGSTPLSGEVIKFCGTVGYTRTMAEGYSTADGSTAEAEGSTSEEETAEPLDVVSLAFAWGCTAADLVDVAEQTGGELWSALLEVTVPPALTIHVDCLDDPLEGAAGGQALAEYLAQEGLLQRPIVLWVGPEILTHTLSPYSRELAPLLEHWAELQGDALPSELQPLLYREAGEDLFYGASERFLHSDEALLEERHRADQTVGIYRKVFAGTAVDVIDLGRVDQALCDSRISPWQSPKTGAPVIIRLDSLAPEAMLQSLLAIIGPVVTRILLCGTGLAGALPDGTVILPSCYVSWAGEIRQPVLGQLPSLMPGLYRTNPNANTGQKAVFDDHKSEEEDKMTALARYLTSLSDHSVVTGTVLSVPDKDLLSLVHLQSLEQKFNLRAVHSGPLSTQLNAVNNAVYGGDLSPQCQTESAVINCSGGDNLALLALPALAGMSAVAVAFVRAVVTPEIAPKKQYQQPFLSSEPHSPPTAPVQRTPSRAAQAMRIKA